MSIFQTKNITEDMTSHYGESPSYAFLRDVSEEVSPESETAYGETDAKASETELKTEHPIQ